MQSCTLHLMALRWTPIDLLMVDICSMVTRKLADRVAERAGVIWHACLQ